MKEEINLLPPMVKQERRHVLLRLRCSQILNRLLIVVTIFCGVSLIEYGALAYLQQAMQPSRNSGADVRINELSSQIRSTNRLLHKVRERTSSYLTSTPLLENLLATVPDGVKLELLSISAKDNTLQLRGVSSSRLSVAQWQQQIEVLPWVSQVDSPLQNFVSQAGGRFSFTLYRKPTP